MKALSVHKLEKLDVIGRNIMTGNMIGFVIWAMVGVIIISLGIRAYLSGKVADFWANIKSISVNDIMGYNHAVGKLYLWSNIDCIGITAAFRTEFSIYFTVSIGSNDRNNSNHGGLQFVY